MDFLRLYYSIKPLIPRRLQLFGRRIVAKRIRERSSSTWPIDAQSAAPPKDWKGWVYDKKFALVLTHDIDTLRGHEKCLELADLEKSLGFFSSFNFVPERYHVSSDTREKLSASGFEIGVHGLKHDGKLYSSLEVFKRRAEKINYYLKEWGAVGFRSPAMHHNLHWLHCLNIKYDCSTFDTDPFEPQSDGVRTIFPFYVEQQDNGEGYVELPYTLPQDHCVFVILGERDISIWKRKLDWIAEKGGMALLNTHPDYMNFNGKKLTSEEYPVRYYVEFLTYVKEKYDGQYWHALPRDVAHFWKKNMVNTNA